MLPQILITDPTDATQASSRGENAIRAGGVFARSFSVFQPKNARKAELKAITTGEFGIPLWTFVALKTPMRVQRFFSAVPEFHSFARYAASFGALFDRSINHP